MDPIDPEPSAAVPAATGVSRPSSGSTGPQPPPVLRRVLIVACLAGAVAGAASSAVGEVIWDRYRDALNPPVKGQPDPADMRRLREARLYSAVWTFTAMGGILGSAMGLSGGLARRSALAGARAALAGLVLGAAAPAAASFLLVSLFYRNHDPHSDSLGLPLLTHGGIWMTVGGIGGLALGLGLGGRRWASALVGGLLGAAAGSVLYEILGAMAFPSSKSDLPLSQSMTTRGMAQFLVAILSATGAAWVPGLATKREPGPPAPP